MIPALLAIVVALAAVLWVTMGNRHGSVTAAVVRPSTAAAAPASGLPQTVPSSVPASAAPSSSLGAAATARPRPSGSSAAVQVPASFPQAGDTGLPSGTRLAATRTKPLRVQKAGTVINGVDIRNVDISVEADNVTIKNSRVVTSGEWGIIQREGVSGLVVEDSEVQGDGTNRLQHAIFNLGGMLTVRRTDMSACSDAISTSTGLIEDNYLHDPVYFDGDHTDMIQSDSGPAAGQQLVIRHNTVLNTLDQTSAVALFQDFGVQHDATIEGNLLGGGGYALYAGAGVKGTSYNIKVVGNVFSRTQFATGGRFGPVAYWDAHGSGNVWQGNVWADTRKPLTP